MNRQDESSKTGKSCLNRQDAIREIIRLRKERNWNNCYGFIVEYLKEHFKIMEKDIRQFKIKESDINED